MELDTVALCGVNLKAGARELLPGVATIDFHITSDCSQRCSYCWGPIGHENPVNTTCALRIISRVREVGARRIVLTGGDPVRRPDLALLLAHAREIGLEVALSSAGSELSQSLLDKIGPCIDLISLPLDGSTEEGNSRTKEKGHFAAVMRTLGWLRKHSEVDVKICTPVHRHNLADVPDILRLVENYAGSTRARVFYNVFQVFPRAMFPVKWNDLLVSDEEFKSLELELSGRTRIRINFLDHKTLDRLYVMIFPDGSLVIPNGNRYLSFGHFLKVRDLPILLETSQFDSSKHLLHSRAWKKDKLKPR